MSRISLTDDDDAIAQKIRKAKTDPQPLPDLASDLAGRPEAANLVGIYGALTGRATDSICAEYAGQGFGAFKTALAELLIDSLRPLRKRFQDLKSTRPQLAATHNKAHEKARDANRKK